MSTTSKSGGSADDTARATAVRHPWADIADRPLEERIGVVAMALLVLLTLANVVVRYLTNQSFAWTEELSVFLLLVLALAGSAVAALQDAHLRIEILYFRGSAHRQRVLALLSAVSVAAMFVLLAVLFVRTAVGEYEFDETTTGLGLPRWWYTAALPLLAASIAVRAVAAYRKRRRDLAGASGVAAAQAEQRS